MTRLHPFGLAVGAAVLAFGAQAADAFFRKYGDYNGDDLVNNADLTCFKASYLNASGYQWYFDFDADAARKLG